MCSSRLHSHLATLLYLVLYYWLCRSAKICLHFAQATYIQMIQVLRVFVNKSCFALMIPHNNIPSPVNYSLFVVVHTPIHHTLPKFTPLPITFPLVWIFMTQLPSSSPSPHSCKSLPTSLQCHCSVLGRILSIVLYVFSSVRDWTPKDVHGPWRWPGAGPGDTRLWFDTDGIR